MAKKNRICTLPKLKPDERCGTAEECEECEALYCKFAPVHNDFYEEEQYR